MSEHVCERGQRFAIYDARGIFCAYACYLCEDEKRKKYRAEIFEDPNYFADEDIEEN